MIGYCVAVSPKLASFRLRVALPSRHLGMPHVIGGVGKLTFFYKNGSPSIARRLPCVVYDVVNAHFDDPDYREMCEIAHVITCSSEAMTRLIEQQFGRRATVITDPYENEEGEPDVAGGVLWFGHQANIQSLKRYAGVVTDVLTAQEWSLEKEARAISDAGVVLLTSTNPGASENRPVKAIRAGRFVVAPNECPQSWRALSEFMWIGDVQQGVAWAFANREEACRKVKLGQQYVRSRFSPQLIGSQWADLFASTLGLATKNKRAG